MTATIYRCPRCNTANDDQDNDAGEYTMCFNCGLMLKFTEDSLIEAPEEELVELRKDRRFRRAEMLGNLLTQVIKLREEPEPDDEPVGHAGLDETPEDGWTIVDHGDHQHRVPTNLGGIALEIHDGEVSLVGKDVELPPELQQMIKDGIEKLRMDEQARDVKRYVTAEVANHVLSAYGDERASMPSLSISALITLIRTCAISDEGLLEELNQSSWQIHGYVVAIMLLAEPSVEKGLDGGMGVLRRIAGIDPPLEGEAGEHDV